MGILNDFAQRLINNIAETVRKFTAFIFLVYTLGILVGIHVATYYPDLQLYALGGPLALAALAYVSTQFAVAIFITMVLFFLI